MQKFEKFYIEKHEFDETSGIAKFQYSFDKNTVFVEEIHFFCEGFEKRNDFNVEIFQEMLFHLSIALGISYYKAFPTREIIVENGFLDDIDIEFWKKFYLHGLGEFLYKNSLSPEELFSFQTINKERNHTIDYQLSEKYLLPIGGGKDSIVSSILLEETHREYTPFVFGKMDEIKKKYLDKTGKKALLIQRKLSEKLFELNAQGYYNGHVPITGIISFVLVATSYLYDYKYIVFSNEKSADEENVMLGGLKVNHQYSKSLQFENDFRRYISKNISEKVEYFSLLRGMYELQIAKIFSKKGKDFFSIFSSCNSNFKILGGLDKKQSFWCNSCPKCLFVYMILRPFISSNEVKQIWGNELYDDSKLLSTFQELIGEGKVKPFECVGEKEEALLAVYLSLQKFDKEVPFLCKYFKDTIYLKYDDDFFIRLKDRYEDNGGDNNIPKKLQEEIRLWLEKEIT